MKLTTRQQARLDSARQIFLRIKEFATDNDAMIFYDNQLIKPEQIEVNDDSIYVVYGKTRIIWFESDPEFDHGVHTAARAFADEVQKSFQVLKPLKYEI